MDKVRYGIIGFGGIAENRIAKEGFACDRSRFQPQAEFELVGATDLNPARQAAAIALGLKWYDTAASLIADDGIGAVFIATNNASHAAVAAQALQAGKHVIVEKPLASKVSDAAWIIGLAAERGLSLSVDHMMIENAWNIKARELVQAGVLGKVNDACFHMEFAYGYDPAEAASWRCSDWAEMGGPIGDVASHCFYMAEYLFAAPIVKVQAAYHPKTMSIRVEDGAYVRCQLGNGMQFSVRAAFSEQRGGLGGTLSNLGYEIYGDQAVLRSYGTLFQLSGHPGEPVSMRLELDRFSSQENVVPGPVRNIYQEVIRRHARSILEGKPINAEEGRHNLELCAASHESAREDGVWVEVPE